MREAKVAKEHEKTQQTKKIKILNMIGAHEVIVVSNQSEVKTNVASAIIEMNASIEVIETIVMIDILENK